jgi:hypothetical protein
VFIREELTIGIASAGWICASAAVETLSIADMVVVKTIGIEIEKQILC